MSSTRNTTNSTDSSDTPYFLEVPRTPEGVAQDRRISLEMLILEHPKSYNKDTVFTCDECSDNNRCIFAFEGYNINNDCLLDK